jgi:hypothetical protein
MLSVRLPETVEPDLSFLAPNDPIRQFIDLSHINRRCRAKGAGIRVPKGGQPSSLSNQEHTHEHT